MGSGGAPRTTGQNKLWELRVRAEGALPGNLADGGRPVVRARTAAKLTQAELARRLGTTQSAVARLEGGRVSPSFATLRRYAKATGTRLMVGLERVMG